MAAALECWSTRTTATATDDDTVEQVLMRSHHRSEGATTPKDPSSVPVHKKLQKLTRNVSEAIASFKNSLNLDSPPSSKASDASSRKLAWGSVVRNLTQLYPGSQLPEKLMSNIRKHYDSLPLSFVGEKSAAAIVVGHYSDGEALKVLTFDSCGCNCGSYNCGVFKSFDIVTGVKLGCF